ncbi:DEAD/DEAH box helicase [Thermodesulfobacteriota bacterium]
MASAHEPDVSRIEFHRQAFGLVPYPTDPRSGVAILFKGERGQSDFRMCSCNAASDKTCSHILELADLYRLLTEQLKGKTPNEDFKNSPWFRLAEFLADGASDSVDSVQIKLLTNSKAPTLVVLGADDTELLSYLSDDDHSERLVERCGRVLQKGQTPVRSRLLEQLSLITLTDSERLMQERGFETNRMVLERSIHYRVAYHCYREFGTSGIRLEPAIDLTTGSFDIICRNGEGKSILIFQVPRKKVPTLIRSFDKLLPNQHGVSIHPVPLKSLFKITADTKMDLELRPMIRLLQEDGEARFFDREDLKRFTYGNLVYIKECGLLAELEKPGAMERRFKAPVNMKLKRSQVGIFMEEFAEELNDGSHIVDPALKELRIFEEPESVEINPEAIDRDWYWISLSYGFGDCRVSLADILKAKEQGSRYLTVGDGWVDCESEAFQDAANALGSCLSMGEDPASSSLRVSRAELLRLQAANELPIEVTGEGDRSLTVKRLLDLRPARKTDAPKGLKSDLRRYQQLGLDWLAFLFENGLGGLLCDDMGLGKTHQVMALMLSLQESGSVPGPMMVICPTTVISHWESKTRAHAPGLKVGIYHGPQRDLAEARDNCHVILTSYGILRNDIERLNKIPFQLVVFDEIQHIKNPDTRAFEAAICLQSKVKLGLTGTPIENRLTELKALFDVTVPGYLGTDDAFKRRYVDSFDPELGRGRHEELGRVISPFVLRRLKKTVLKELPDKIEDIRTCRLSDDQVKLYREAIDSKGHGLVEALNTKGGKVPYIHIFAVLTLLKQICDHPALVNDPTDYGEFESGKWDLFKEILSESLESEQKVVVYSQFLGMLGIIERHLEELGAGFVSLSGSTRDRGRVISRFNEDPSCRVFVGSLKAGGVGIDLVAASVVIHYDRWWNAAREDQATDRVHRIGQKRGVHVFKLVTEGTLEEKISAIIERKRILMDNVVQEDDPGTLKTFSREDLVDLLTFPL